MRAETPYVWDGKDEEERPVSRDEMQDGVEAYRRGRGRPSGSDKESTTIRFDRDILEVLSRRRSRLATRLNAALREWLKTHPSV